MSKRSWRERIEAARNEIDGPVRIFGYDNKIHLDRASSADWRVFHVQRARRMGTHTRAEWNELRDRIGYCVCCGRSDVRLAKDHIIPVSRYGCDCISNLQPLCDSCNSSKCARL